MTNHTITTDELERLAEHITEGPWAAFSEHPLNACAEVRKGHTNIATCYGGDDPCDSPAEGEPWPNQPRRDANARLIAMAPALLRELIARRKADEWQPTHRHVKRGTEYREVARGKLQTDNPLTDYAELVAYHDHDGNWWFRAPSEFDDGRFTTLTAGDSHENDR